MKRNFFKGTAIAAIALAGFTVTAQEEESKGIELTGSVDAYFRANLNGKNGNGASAPATSFANGDGFALGMVNLIASKQLGKVGFVADLVYGPRGADAVFNSTGSSNIINQLYVTYAASDAVTFTLGNFNTFLGYEVISPTGNFNYSTSYMFSYGPFSHTGLKADFAIDDNWSLMASVMNATDFTEANQAGKYTGGLQLGYSNDTGSAYLNVLYGNQGDVSSINNSIEVDRDESGTITNSIKTGNTFQVDLTTGWDVSEEFYLGVNATYNTTSFENLTEGAKDPDNSGFYGVALYPQYAISEAFTLGLRGEYFAEFEGGVGALTLDKKAEGSVFATTLTGSFTSGALTIKPEFRIDSSDNNEDTFADFNGKSQKSLASFMLGAIYSF